VGPQLSKDVNWNVLGKGSPPVHRRRPSSTNTDDVPNIRSIPAKQARLKDAGYKGEKIA